MKRIVTVLLFLLLLNIASNGQQYYRTSTSVGLRIGFPYGLTVRHFIDRYNALEFIAAANLRGFIAAGLIENEHKTFIYPGLYWYWGLGVHGGVVDTNKNTYIYTRKAYAGPVFGVDAVIGLDYTFREIPLNLSFDLLPSINLAGYTGWNGLNTALSARYVF
jgi:hypothetical protein